MGRGPKICCVKVVRLKGKYVPSPMSMAPKTERFEMRLETTMIKRVEAWRRKQEDLPSRAEAFRRLIELGLSTKNTGAKVKT